MRRALCHSLPKRSQDLVEIPENEAKHLTSVLRLGPNDEVELIDGSGYRVKASLVFRDKKVFGLALAPPETDPHLLSLPVHLNMSIIKGDAMEWVIEKAVELGVRSLTPIETEFTVIKTAKKGASAFQERWQKIADQSLKQCGRLDRMVVHSPQNFEESFKGERDAIWLDESLAETAPLEAHLARWIQNRPQFKEVSVWVGPEGGFSPSEKSRLLHLTSSSLNSISRVHLGKIILRAETAAILGISVLVGGFYGKK